MENFGKDIQITDAESVYPIVYRHKINAEIFWSECLSLAIFVAIFYVCVNIYNILKVVLL